MGDGEASVDGESEGGAATADGAGTTATGAAGFAPTGVVIGDADGPSGDAGDAPGGAETKAGVKAAGP
jgi:hypothetical protein